MKASRVLAWSVGVGSVVVGLGLVLLWTSFATLYVPQCPEFSIRAANANCRDPVLWVYAGYLIALLGVALSAVNVVRAVRARSRSRQAAERPDGVRNDG